MASKNLALRKREASKNLNVDDHLHFCLVRRFLTPSTCKLETKSFLDTVYTMSTTKLWLSFFFKVGSLG